MTDTLYNRMTKLFESLGQDALYMNHYELSANLPDYNKDKWLEYLQDHRVVKKIKTEKEQVTDVQMRKLLRNISTKDNAIGKAQILTALHRINEGHDTKKEGPPCIYMYVPLNEQEKGAPDTVLLDSDPFNK